MSILSLISFAESLPRIVQQSNAVAALEARRLLDERIFERGETCTGDKIGDYSTKETLVGQSSFLTKKGAERVLGSKRKRGNLQWVTIDGKRLAKLPGGYAVIRDADGRQTSFVDLFYSGNLRNDLSAVPTQQGFEVGFFSKESTKKADGAESNPRLNGPIFCLSEPEINSIIQTQLSAVFG